MADYTELIKALREEACNPFSHIEDARLMCRAAEAIEELSKCLEGVCADNDNLTQKLTELNQKYIDASNEMQRQMCRADGGKWISVDDRLPEADKDILVRGKDTFNGNMLFVGYYSNRLSSFMHYTGHMKQATHWMLLPELPKEET